MKSKRKCLLPLAAILLLSLSILQVEAHLRERFFLRRQSPPAEPAEKESTTSSSKPADTGNPEAPAQSSLPAGMQAPPRLYPDLPRLPDGFNQQAHNQFAMHGPPTPFIPSFGYQPAGNGPQQPGFQQVSVFNRAPAQQGWRPPQQLAGNSAAERQHSLAFTNGLGARLLAMMGIKPAAGDEQSSGSGENSLARTLQNSTVLGQLSKGVQTVYGNLARLYNSTVQQQLGLLQERLAREAENSTNPWQQRMAKQVPEFFKQVAVRLGEAQERLNRLAQQVGRTVNNASALDQLPQLERRRNLFDQFEPAGFPEAASPFFDPLANSWAGPGGSGARSAGQNGTQMQVAERLRAFWHQQVEPQIGSLRGQLQRVWRDFSNSGMLIYNDLFAPERRSQAGQNSSELVDEILKSVELSADPEVAVFATAGNELETAKSERLQEALGAAEQSPAANRTMELLANSQRLIQNGLTNAQRELNQLWGSLSSSLQNAMVRVRSAVAPQQAPFPGHLSPTGSQQPPAADPAENELDGKLKELSKIQREADTVYESVQRQQQRSSFADNFRNFFSNFNEQVEQFPARFGQSVNRFGSAVNDFWHTIPSRWNAFVENIRPQEQPEVASMRLQAPKQM